MGERRGSCLEATERKVLVQVEHREIVDGNHPTFKLSCYGEALVLVGSENGGAESVARAVGDSNGFFDGIIRNDEHDRSEDWET